MEKRAALMAALAKNPGLHEQASLVAQLDELDRETIRGHTAARELGFADDAVAQALTPVHVAQQHTAATDWLGDEDTSGGPGWQQDMTAQAALWYRRTSSAVKDDPDEFAEQARGMARILAGKYGEQAPVARGVFTKQAAVLWYGDHMIGDGPGAGLITPDGLDPNRPRPHQAASGIPQIDQLIDPNNQPGPTPYPTEVFDNFQPPVHPINQGIEDESGAGWASGQAPMIQALEQMNGGGSGFGSGAEKPDEHDLDDDVDGPNSYAEIPLGAPGQIATGARQAQARIGTKWSSADSDGYHWPLQMYGQDEGGANWDVDTQIPPHHASCGTGHWPSEPCGDVSRETSHEAAATCSKCHHPAHGDGKCSNAGCNCHGVSSVTASLVPPPTVAMDYRFNMDDYREQEAMRQRSAARRVTADDDSRPAYDSTQEGQVGDTDHDTWDEGGLDETGQAHEGARRSDQPSQRALGMFGHMDAMEGKAPHHRDAYPFGPNAHGAYLRGWNRNRGAIDAIMNREPLAKPEYSDMTGRPDLHNHYMSAYAEGAEARDARTAGREPNFSERQAASGLTQVQEIVDPNNRPDLENDQLPQATMFPWTIDQGDGQSLPGPESAPRDVGRVAQAALMADIASLRTWADQFSSPHGTTDDQTPVANSAATTPPPATGAEAQGARDGARDRAAGDRPSFSTADSHASPYVKAYSEAYANGAPQAPGGDAPYSMGGDSGQAGNSQEAQQLAEVNKAASRRTARYEPDSYDYVDPSMRSRIPQHVMHDLWSRDPDGGDHEPTDRDYGKFRDYVRNTHGQDVHDAYFGESGGHQVVHPYSHADVAAEDAADREHWGDPGHHGSRRQARDVSQAEREKLKAKGDTLPGTDKLPVANKSDLKNAEDLKGKVKGASPGAVDAYLEKEKKKLGVQRLTASRAFVPAEALKDESFRQGYYRGLRWGRASRVPQMASPAFESGLYAGITDAGLRAQLSFVARHRTAAANGRPELMERISAHQEFSFALARRQSTIRVQGSYIQAARPREDAVFRGSHLASPNADYFHGAHDFGSKTLCGRKLDGMSEGNVTRAMQECPSCARAASGKTAATSTDLETTAPGTSADPMGSTPLNGPGTPPPMAGGSDPARAGGPSPYQGAPPMGQGPVAPDPVMGDQQPSPPPTGEVMGGEGYSGYLNPAAYKGNPQGGPKQAAFRATVQANLAKAGAR